MEEGVSVEQRGLSPPSRPPWVTPIPHRVCTLPGESPIRKTVGWGPKGEDGDREFGLRSDSGPATPLLQFNTNKYNESH